MLDEKSQHRKTNPAPSPLLTRTLRLSLPWRQRVAEAPSGRSEEGWVTGIATRLERRARLWCPAGWLKFKLTGRVQAPLPSKWELSEERKLLPDSTRRVLPLSRMPRCVTEPRASTTFHWQTNQPSRIILAFVSVGILNNKNTPIPSSVYGLLFCNPPASVSCNHRPVPPCPTVHSSFFFSESVLGNLPTCENVFVTQDQPPRPFLGHSQTRAEQ